MSASKLNVLAVMRDVAEFGVSTPKWHFMPEAAAAVAELIEAAKRSERHLLRINQSSGWRDGEQAVLDQLSAALARIGSAS